MAKFRTRARTLDLLGRQQIAGVPTAINELLKNAHDAYADNVDIDYLSSEMMVWVCQNLILRIDGLLLAPSQRLKIRILHSLQ